jgi:cyclopropane fatty-acyl-phospholipid synthase-like methyltransferase
MKEYQAALTFWNDFFKKEKPEKLHGASLGCTYLEDKLKELVDVHRVLDFGCGTGWASLYLKQIGCEDVTGVDQAANAIDIATETARINGFTDGVTFIKGDDTYFDNVKCNVYDGFFSSNTFDVIPTEVTTRILTQVKRICMPNARILIMINPYLTQELNEKIKMEQISQDSFTKNGILRCVNRTKDEWVNIFEQYFTLETYDEFECDDEPKGYGRRMFGLRNKK